MHTTDFFRQASHRVQSERKTCITMERAWQTLDINVSSYMQAQTRHQGKLSTPALCDMW